jgi:hypothetical protein
MARPRKRFAERNSCTAPGELRIDNPDKGRMALPNGYGSHAETVRRVRDSADEVVEFPLGGSKLLAEDNLALEVKSRHMR